MSYKGEKRVTQIGRFIKCYSGTWINIDHYSSFHVTSNESHIKSEEMTDAYIWRFLVYAKMNESAEILDIFEDLDEAKQYLDELMERMKVFPAQAEMNHRRVDELSAYEFRTTSIALGFQNLSESIEGLEDDLSDRSSSLRSIADSIDSIRCDTDAINNNIGHMCEAKILAK